MKCIFIIVVCMHAAVSWYNIVTTTAPDFSVYYYSTQRLVAGLPIYGSTGLFTGLGYPPQSLLFYLPFTLMPYQLAQGIWISVSFLLLPVIVWLTVRLLNWRVGVVDILCLSCLFFLSFPTKFTLGMGQVNLLALTTILLSFYCSNSKTAGLFLGLSVLLKPQLVFVGLLFLLFKKWRELQWAVLLNCIAVVFVLLFFGDADVIRYLTVETKSLSAYIERGVYYNQGISGFLSRITTDSTAATVVPWIRVGIIVLSAALLWRKTIDKADAACLSLLYIVLLLPVSWQHHFVFLFPAYIWSFRNATTNQERVFLLASAVLVSWNTKQPESVFLLPGFILSHGFFGVVLLWLLTLHLLKKRA